MIRDLLCIRRLGIGLLLALCIGAGCSDAQAPSTNPKFKAEREKLRPLHQKLGKSQPGDWLLSHEEPGQTFDQYLAARPVTPTGQRRIIYLLPVGDFTPKQQEIVHLTGEYLSLCYNRPVKTLAKVPLADIPEKAQRELPGLAALQPPPASPLSDVLAIPVDADLLAEAGPAEDKQLLTTYLLEDLLPKRLPADGAALIALTASDLWPGPGWNFVFGQASLKNRVGVWSIHRNGDPAESDDEFRLCLRRTLKTASHELGHMFTIQHCTAFECNMCGANNRSEADRRPLAFCPECASKLWWATQAEPREHYRKLAAFCEKHGLSDDAKFYKASAEALSAN